MIPDFRNFKGEGMRQLMHSAKGTTWTKENAKYTDKVKTKSGKWRYIYGGKGGGTGSTVPFTVGYVGTLAMEADKKRKANTAEEAKEIASSGKSLRESLSTAQKNSILNGAKSEEKTKLVKELSDAISSGKIGRAIFMFDRSNPNQATLKVDGCEIKLPTSNLSTHTINPSQLLKDVYVGIPGTGQTLRIADNSYGYKQYLGYTEVKNKVTPAVTQAKGKSKSGGTTSGLGKLMGK